MAVSTSYRLPGVYSEETTAPSANIVAGGNAVVAIVGPALGYTSASQFATMNGTEGVALANGVGVVSGSVKVVNRYTGVEYDNGVDFLEVPDTASETGVTTVYRKLTALSLTKHTVSKASMTYYVAEPTFDIMFDGSGDSIDGYVIAGTLSITDKSADGGDAVLVEGRDYEVDYHKGLVAAKADGDLINANGHVLEITFDWTTAEPIELVGESAFPLEHKFISENGIEPATDGQSGVSCNIVSCVYTDGGTTYSYGDTPGADDGYVEGVDFVVDYQTGRITRTSDSRIPSYSGSVGNYMYVEFAYCAIKSGEAVRISYSYRGDDYLNPRIVQSYAEVAKWYGEAWDPSTGEVVSPLSLAAYVAFQNGMPYCYTAAVERVYSSDSSLDYTTTSWEDAFSRLAVIDGIDIVVPLTDDSTALAFAVSHIVAMTANQDERCLIVGADGTERAVSNDDMIAFASGFSREDVWAVAPSTFRFRNPVKGVVEPIAGYYMAAAVAGYNASVPQYTPLTRKVISGFYSANEYNVKLTKQNLCANGLMYVDEVNGQLRVLHGRTTSVSSTTKTESNVTLTKYFIIKRIRRMFENGYIGTLMNAETVMGVYLAAQSILINMRENNYLYNFYGLSVAVDDLLPTQLNVSFSYRPTYSLNYIDVSFSLDSSVDAVEV